MAEKGQDTTAYRLAGYGALIERYNLDVSPNWHKSLAARLNSYLTAVESLVSQPSSGSGRLFRRQPRQLL
jgi:hypothetical protein